MTPQIRRNRAYPVAAVITVAVGTALALATGAQAAVQVKSPPNHVIAIQKTATLKADGAAVLVRLDIVCPTGTQPSIGVTITAAVAGSIIEGYGSGTVTTCTGEPQTISIGAAARAKPFVAGSAWADVSLNSNGYPPINGEDSRTITIK